ncbi:MAG: hypothetical protein ACRETQ_05410 [Gammaproteobacteria bacterium]
MKNDFGVISGISETGKPQELGEDWSCSVFTPADVHTCLGFVREFGKMKPLQPLAGGYNGFTIDTNDRFQTVWLGRSQLSRSTLQSRPVRSRCCSF